MIKNPGENEIFFCFDYISPYAYLGWEKLKKLAQKYDWKVTPRPVVFGALLGHWGQLGPAEMAPKRFHVFRDCLIQARREKILLNAPHSHPFLSLMALRASLKSVVGEKQDAVIDGFWRAAWVEEKNIADSDVIYEILEQAGVDPGATLQAVQTQEIKNELKAQTQWAMDHGVFGVPTFILQPNQAKGLFFFWGVDQLLNVEEVMLGKDLYQERELEKILDRPVGIQRRDKRVRAENNS